MLLQARENNFSMLVNYQKLFKNIPSFCKCFSFMFLFLLQVRKSFLPNVVSTSKFPEKILFCGWRRDIDDMIMVF